MRFRWQLITGAKCPRFLEVCTTKAGRPDTFSSGFISQHQKSSFPWESPLPFLGTNVEADSFICIRGFSLTSNDAVSSSKIFLSGDFMVASRTLSSWRNTCLLSGVSLASRHHLIMENESLKDDEWNNKALMSNSMLPEFVETGPSLLKNWRTALPKNLLAVCQ